MIAFADIEVPNGTDLGLFCEGEKLANSSLTVENEWLCAVSRVRAGGRALNVLEWYGFVFPEELKTA
ncbi:hypothetical protein TNCV_1298931 [Trichonephila clavipes]|nr:hypothetical protein TNCV_1298931 [Trichonephila clavipes]